MQIIMSKLVGTAGGSEYITFGCYEVPSTSDAQVYVGRGENVRCNTSLGSVQYRDYQFRPMRGSLDIMNEHDLVRLAKQFLYMS